MNEGTDRSASDAREPPLSLPRMTEGVSFQSQSPYAKKKKGTRDVVNPTARTRLIHIRI